MDKPVFPKEVDLGEDAIVILWDDGHRSPYPHRYLRLRCRCANCVEEMSGRPRLDPDQVPQDVRAVDQMPVGNYALQFLWSDTHYTGIYTYDFLRSLCTCNVCTAAGAPGQEPS
jgi:DUF971 family protein